MMWRTAAILAVALAGSAAASEPQIEVLEPPAALALAQTAPSKGWSGRFAMTVLAAEKTSRATFLNSTEDYRRPDNVTFRLSPRVAKALHERFGAPPESYLIGKRVIVDGRIQRRPVVNVRYGKPHSFNRFQHMVEIDATRQILAVNDAL